MSDGSIVISTKLDNAQLERDFAKLRKEVEKLEQTTADQEAKKAPLVVQAQELESRMREARAEVERYRAAWAAGVAGADKEQSTAIMKTQQLEVEHARVVAQIDKIDAKLQPAYAKTDAIKEKAGGVARELAKAGVNTERMGGAVKKAGKSLDRFKLRLREVVRSALVFTLITQALAKFREWTGKVIKTNDEASQAVARLKGALLVLAQPLVNVIIPAFTLLVNLLSQVASALANVVATIFGMTAEEARNAAEGLYEETSALDGVGSAAKKASKSLANFDDLNKLSGDSSKSSADSTIAPDFSGVGDSSWLEKVLGDAAGKVADALLLGGIALVAIGAATGSLPTVAMGLLLLGIGLSLGSTSDELQSWVDRLGLNSVREFVIIAILLAGIAIVAIAAATGNILMVIAGLVLIGVTIAYTQSSGMMNSWTEEQISRAASIVTGALILGGIVLIAIGAATANILMVFAGLGLLAAGIYVGVKSGTLASWAEVLGLTTVFDYVVVAIQLVGIVLIAIGAVMANIAMVIAGAVILAAGLGAEVVGQETLQNWWDVLKLTTIQQWVSVALLLVGIALIAIGAVMGNILMVIAGAAILAFGVVVAVQNDNLKDWATTLGLEKIIGWVTTVLKLAGIAFVVFGILMMNILMIVAGVGLFAAGVAIDVASGKSESWVDALHLNEVAGWVSTAMVLAGIALIAIGAMTLNPLLILAGLGLIGGGVAVGIMNSRKASQASMPSMQTARVQTAAMPSIASYPVPHLARGAVIPPNREFLAVLGDQKSGTNIEAPEGLIRQIIREEMGSMRVTVENHVNFEGDLAQVGRVLHPVIQSEAKRAGDSLVTVGSY